MQHNLCLLKTEHTEDNTVNSSSFGDIDSFYIFLFTLEL